MKWAIGSILMLGVAPQEEEPEVWVFFGAEGPDASPIFRALAGRRVRAAFLAERYFGGREPSESLLSAAKASGGFRVADEEGLREAERLGISDLPAVAVRRGGRVHVASGSRLDVKEVLGCLK